MSISDHLTPNLKFQPEYKSACKLIEKHQLKIEILEAIQHFARMIEHKQESIDGFPGTFINLRMKYLHNIEIYNKCINRLKQRYNEV